MRKLGTGYTNYFNKKYKRVGSLFQGIYKFTIVKDEAHFIHLPHYIHCNPLGEIFPKWKEDEIDDYKKALNYLDNYQWSSYQDYIGKRNFPLITQRDFLLKFFNSPDQYKKDTAKWLKEIHLGEIEELERSRTSFS